MHFECKESLVLCQERDVSGLLDVSETVIL